MSTNKSLLILILSVWLLPLASFQLRPFGIPLYPLEILLLCASPFLWENGMRGIFRTSVVRKILIFALGLLGGTLLSFFLNPPSLAGLGQIKSFFFFPIVFWLFATPLLKEFTNRERVLWHLRLMFALGATVALVSGFLGGLTYDSRLSAWFDSPNLLALFLLPGVTLWSAQLLSAKKVSLRELIGWVVVTSAFALTQSYGAIFAASLAVGAFVWIFGAYVPWKRLLGTLMLAGLLFLGGLVFVSGERGLEKWTLLVTGDERSSLSSRHMIWKAAFKMIEDSPWVGIGPGRFQSVYLEYQRFYPPYLEWAVPHPHNLLAALWLSSGIAGVLASLWLCFFVLHSLKDIARKKEQALLAALFVGVFMAGLGDVPYFRSELCLSWWFALALFSGMLLEKESPSHS
jgi:O-antigen ligase